MTKKLIIKQIAYGVLIFFVLLNLIAAFHAYSFTHFDPEAGEKPKVEKMPFGKKLKSVLFGVNNPRPKTQNLPIKPYQTIVIQGEKKLETWLLNPTKSDSLTPIIAIFHGYGGEKSKMLPKAEVLVGMGYKVLLVDFRGAGGSEGNECSIGYHEANDVNAVYAYLDSIGEKNIVLFGTSMGAVAIMKALADFNLKASSVILECPFGTMSETVAARFKLVGIPAFPLSDLLMFWGGVENGFNAYEHNPSDYALKINSPTLLMYGEKDEKVSKAETDTIFNRLHGKKTLKTFPLSGHESYLNHYPVEWAQTVSQFLKQPTGSFEDK